MIQTFTLYIDGENYRKEVSFLSVFPNHLGGTVHRSGVSVCGTAGYFLKAWM